MASRPAPALALRDGDREELTRMTRASTVKAGLAQRARIVLLAAAGESNTAIADKVGASGQIEQYRRSIAPVRIVGHRLVVLSPTGLSSQTPMLDQGHEPLLQRHRNRHLAL